MLVLISTKFRQKKPLKNGFSLLELLICISIMLVLATVAVPKFTSAGKTAKIAKIQTDIRTISNTAALYEAENGKFPETVEILAVKTNGKTYLQFLPKVPDGTAYLIDEEGVVSAVYEGTSYDSKSNAEAVKS
ncbi:type II secretion system protein G (GspG) [Megasphaera paucivorans]|uniref:Type II secretion system protein G (GspG) n=1 Tax=Megasphaera paucivorans TaxID=349095 RepID=A0A1G9UHK5_9FIRM|nr:prepilin-type N-terminal cleavage/methylation domain-containing protein [Megasphaera paucivorans]SDM59398.1 type II secretion system protein G (GspG) [Megasphaera paucivorans]